MTKQFAQSRVWLLKSYPNVAHEVTLVNALRELFKLIQEGRIDWDTFTIEHEMIGSHHPVGIGAGISFSVIYEPEHD